MSNSRVQSDDSTLLVKCRYFPTSNEKIGTKDFLQASSNAVSLMERFGKVFTPITNDMRENIIKLTMKYEEDTHSNKYLDDMIIGEQSSGRSSATEALLWLKRCLHFLSNLFHLIIEENNNGSISNDLAPLLQKAYADTLEPYHGWLGTQLFTILFRYMPFKKQVFFTLACDKYDCDESVLTDMKIYNDYLSTTVRRLTQFYVHNGLESLNV
ncbi:pleckstrin homology domain-containing family A member 8 [Diorhabda sublineata]|uniref:pleckstrin homology domain-containing family A member 8 n=1 Tax=Diorhabda sublineata TaxID=1163346 RepID=UPI0024E14102|nr:pleckstrin homology domain-containing family A member 8 [Diorhabda sublineata]